MKKAFAIVLATVLIVCALLPASAATQADGTLALTVKDETNRFIYQSYDGGKAWFRNSKPLVYISIENTVVPLNDGKVTYTVHNNTAKEIGYGQSFSLEKWNGQKWVTNSKFNEIDFDLDLNLIAPKASRQDVAAWEWMGIKTGVGKYKLVKKITVENRQFTCEAEFVITDSLPELIVKDETNRLIYKSNDGGKTWERNSKPPVHISIGTIVVPKKDGEIRYTVHNNTKNWQNIGAYYDIQKWNGQKWVRCPELDGLVIDDIEYGFDPNGSWSYTASWGKNKLGAGKYKLIKKMIIDNRQFTCEAVFVLE